MKIITYSIFSVIVLILFGCSTPKQSDLSSPLDDFLNKLSSSSSFRVFWREELSEPISDASVKTNLVKWIQSQSFEYNDELTTLRRKNKGGGLGCIAVDIVLPSEESIMIAHELLLVGDPVTAYMTSKQCCEFNLDEVLIIAGIIESPVIIELSTDETLVLYDFMFMNSITNEATRKVGDAIHAQIADRVYLYEDTLEQSIEEAKDRLLKE